jgi:LysM repeat protein
MALYTVQPGDNPSKIAQKFGMTLAQFQKINPELVEWGSGKWKVLFPGQIVNVKGTVTGLPADAPSNSPASFSAPPP